MMLTMHGLPNKTKFQDVKALIRQECNIPDFILDCLVEDGYDSKKVRIGLTNEIDGYRLMKSLNGFRMSGSHVLKIVPVGKPLTRQPVFEQNSNYSTQHKNDYSNTSYSNQNDYNRNSSNHISTHSSGRNAGAADTRHHDRGLSEARQSLSQVMSDSRAQERITGYQGSIDRRPVLDRLTLGCDTRSDFRDASRGALVPPTIRPASMDTMTHGPFDTRVQHGSLNTGGSRGISDVRQDGSRVYRGLSDHRQVSNPEPIHHQPQWTAAGGTDQWSSSGTPMENQNTGYNYQQPQGTTGFVQQSNSALQTNYPSGRAVQTLAYQQPKSVAPERNPQSSTRTHVLRSVEIVDQPIQPRAPPTYPPQQKPITIMKDNFQGPTQYNITGQIGSQAYQGQGSTQQAWSQGQTKQLAYDKSYDDRRLAMDKTQGKSQPASQDYEKRRYSPTRSGRAASPERRSSPPLRSILTNPRPQNYPERAFTDRRSPNRHVTANAEFPTTGRDVSPSKTQTTRRNSPSRKISPRRLSPTATGRRISPFSRKISPSRRVSPPRKISPIGRRVSPKNPSPGRRTSPFTRKISPPGRVISTGRRVSPTGRRVSPTARRVSPTGRRVSPTGRRVSPTGRRVSPTGRRVSPSARRGSPSARRVSPNGSPAREEPRRMSPSMMKYHFYLEEQRRMGVRVESPRRYSPKRSPIRGSGRYSPSETKYDSEIADNKGSKPIRPAYEAKQAQKYTGAGFHQKDTQYAASGARNESKISSWHSEKNSYPPKKEDRERDTRMNRPDPIEKKTSPRRSRSRSPVKDRYRRHSPSPRSPRRSWALEKRRSPETIREPPPPPLWPGQEAEEKSNDSTWERNDPEEHRRFDDKRGRNEDKYTPRFSPRRDVDERREYRNKKIERKYSSENRSNYRKESPQRDEKKLFTEVDKDFNDIYQRAVEFRRKTEELRKSNDRRNRSYESMEEDDMPRRENNTTRSENVEKPKSNWIPIKIQSKDVDKDIKNMRLDSAIREKREKASEEIANRILEPHSFAGEQKERVVEKLKLSVNNILLEMFKNKDVSYIELVIKFRARYDVKDEEKILLDALTSLPNHYMKMLKRKGEDITEVPPKIQKVAPAYVKEEVPRPKLCDAVIPDWHIPIEPPKVISIPTIANTGSHGMVPPPVYLPLHAQMYQSALQSNMRANMTLQPNIQENLHSQMQPNFNSNMQEMHEIQSRIQSHIQSNIQPNILSLDGQDLLSHERGYNLYLCQDDFEPFSENQAEKLRSFLVTQMFKASETGNGWAPDFAFIGLHSVYRYELSTNDEMSKNWVLNLDFSDFEFFNVLVYTKEELWYERAAIWLPGHSRYRNIEPLDKLRLQNRQVEGINIGKWKFVKKIVTDKGTRLYVDMPPSSARALEKTKMLLSYELGKVNVYLKAVAVDKDVFDAGLKAPSLTDPSQLATAVQSSIMPTIPSNQIGVIKVTLNGAKILTIQQASKIKEMIVYNLLKYHLQEGRLRTDFLKYGFCPPNCIGLVPENAETKKWLMCRSFGKLNRRAIIILDGEDTNIRYFRMISTIPNVCNIGNLLVVMEKFKTSNQGVKGLNFHLWKPVAAERVRGGKSNIEIDVDLESTETLIKLNFKLDYVTEEYQTVTAKFRSDYSQSKLLDRIRKYKVEQMDSYVVANMELDSDSN